MHVLHYNGITSHGLALNCTTAHYITLHYITLHYLILHYTTLHYIILLHCIKIKSITLYYVLLCIALHCIALHYLTLHYISVHYSAVQCSTVQYSAVQFIDGNKCVYIYIYLFIDLFICLTKAIHYNMTCNMRGSCGSSEVGHPTSSDSKQRGFGRELHQRCKSAPVREPEGKPRATLIQNLRHMPWAPNSSD